MVTVKQLIFTLALGGLMAPAAVKADKTEDAITAIAATGIVAAAGYGLYKICEWNSFDRAQKVVASCDDTLQALYPKYQHPLNSHHVVSDYKHHMHAFDTLKFRVADDARTCYGMHYDLQSIQRGWATTSYAAPLVAKARELSKQNTTLSAAVQAHQELLEQVTPVIAIENMMAHEKQTAFYDITHERNKHSFDATVTTAYAESKWPFLSAYSSIDNRKNEYQHHLAHMNRIACEFPATVTKAKAIVAGYKETQTRIVANPRYTEDQRYKQQYDNEQERLRIERKRLQAAQAEAQAAQDRAYATQQAAYAARRQAYAAERQARAAEAQVYAARTQQPVIVVRID